MRIEQRIIINNEVKNFFISELKRVAGDRFHLIENHLDELISSGNLRQCTVSAKLMLKKLMKRSR